MIKKIKRHILLLSSIFMLAAPTLAPTAIAAAADNNCTGTGNSIATGASAAANVSGGGDNGTVKCGTPDTSTTGIQSLAGHIVNIFSIIVGIVSIIMIIYGGFRYITSGGSNEGVAGAKNTIVYAIIGLIIVALAQVLVHFVLSATSTVTG